jgi:invasion protein IalB
MFRIPFLVLCLAGLATTAHAQDETFGVWRYSCADGPCQAYFGLAETVGGPPAVGLGMVHDKQSDRTTLILTAPVRTALPPGAQIRIPEHDPIPVPFQFCDPDGCVGFVTDQRLVDLLDASSHVTILYYRYGTTRPMVYEVPITGFADARSRLRM